MEGTHQETTVSVLASVCGAGIALLTQQRAVTPRDALLSFLSGSSLSVFVLPAAFEYAGITHGPKTYAAAMFCGLVGSMLTRSFLRVFNRRIEGVIDHGVDRVAPWAKPAAELETSAHTDADADADANNNQQPVAPQPNEGEGGQQ